MIAKRWDAEALKAEGLNTAASALCDFIRSSASALIASMKPTIVIVGRPNVGKSTLFNRLTRSRDAIVADAPGITRDRHYGHGRIGDKPYLVVDTGGFEPVAKDGIYHEMARQTRQAVDEADAVLFVMDARAGLTAQDRIIGSELRKTGRKIWLVVNKAEGMVLPVVTAEFHELGLGDPLAISAMHGDSISRSHGPGAGGVSRRRGVRAGRRASIPASRSSAGPTSANRHWSTRCSAKNA